MMTPLGGLLVASLYFAFSAILWVGLSPRVHQQRSSQVSAATNALAPIQFLFWTAALGHGTVTALDLIHTFPDASISKAFSLTSLLMLVVLLCLCTRYRLQLLLLFFAPLAGIAALISAFDRDAVVSFSTDPLVFWHLTTGLVGATISLLTLPLAFVAQCINRGLHQAVESRWFVHLPPLATIEKLIINLLVIAVALLVTSIAFTIPTITDIGEQRLAHKIFFSGFSLLILASLLGGRWLYGWRGKRLVYLVYAANACLILAYFGTKLVLELILRD